VRARTRHLTREVPIKRIIEIGANEGPFRASDEQGREAAEEPRTAGGHCSSSAMALSLAISPPAIAWIVE
jgi:hypothetical protein